MRYSKLLLVCVAGLVFCLSVSVRAQNPTPSPTISLEKQALIKELVELTSSQKTIDAVFKAQAEQVDKELPQVIWQAISGMKELKALTPEQREELRLKVISASPGPGKRMYEVLREKIDFHQMIEDISLPLHDKYFTETELRDLVTFYKSPTGKKVIEVMPNLLTETMSQTVDAIFPRMAEITSQIQREEIQRMEIEIKASVKPKQAPTKSTPRTPQKRRRP